MEVLKANNLVESLEIGKGATAKEYIDYLESKGVNQKDSKNILVLVSRVHLVRYGKFKSDVISKAAEKEGVKSIKALEEKYFNRLVESLKEDNKTLEITPAQDPQIEKWNNKLNTIDKINHQINSLKKIINKRKKESPLLNLIPCNGFIISKILQTQGVEVQYNRTDFKKCYYNVKESSLEVLKIAFKDNNDNLHYYDINLLEQEDAIKEEFSSVENVDPAPTPEDQEKIKRFLNLSQDVKMNLLLKSLDMSFKKILQYDINNYSHLNFMNKILRSEYKNTIDRTKLLSFKDIFVHSAFKELIYLDLIIDYDPFNNILYDTLLHDLSHIKIKDYFKGKYHENWKPYEEVI